MNYQDNTPDRLIHSLTIRYVIALSLIALTAVVGQFIIQFQLLQQIKNTHIVNIAARQRTLSQRLTKAALALQTVSDPDQQQDYIQELLSITDLWEKFHHGLQYGDRDLGLPPETNPQIIEMYQEIEPHHQRMLQATKKLLLQWDEASEAEIDSLISSILVEEASFLAGMDRIVFQYAYLASDRVSILRQIELGLLIVTLLVLVGEVLWVFRPALQRTREALSALQKSESLYRRMFNEHSSIRLLIDPESYKIVDANTAATEFYRTSLTDLTQKKSSDLNLPAPDMMLQATSQTQDHFEVKHYPVPDDLHYIEIRATPIEVKDQKLVFAVMHDITQRKQTEIALRENEEKFRTLLAHAPEGVIIVDEAGKISLVNRRTKQIFGYSGKEMIGQPIEFLLPDSLKKYHVKLRQGFIEDPHNRSMGQGIDLVAKRKDGSIFPVEIGLSVTQTKNSTLVMSYITDITERKKVEEAIHQTNATLKRRVDELSTLNSITQTVATVTDLHAALEPVTRQITTLFEVQGTTIFLLNEQRTQLKTITTDQPNPKLNELKLTLESYPAAQKTIEKGKVVTISEAQTHPSTQIIHDILSECGTETIVHLPLLARGETIGLISIFIGLSKEPFSADELSLAETIAGQIAGAVENARLFEQEQHQRQVAEERSQELAQTLKELKDTQRELIQSEKMAALGQLIAGVAHEINTPLGTIRAAIGNIMESLQESTRQLPQVLLKLSEQKQQIFFDLLDNATETNSSPITARQERKHRRQLRRVLEGHEIDHADHYADLLTDISIYEDIEPFIPLLKDQYASLTMESAYKLVRQHKNAENIQLAVERAAKIVFALKKYARHDPSAEKIVTDIPQTVETILTLYHNQIKQGIEVIKDYQEVPPIPCYPDELNQVWTNLVHNALQAMDYKGTLKITIETVESHLVVSFTDNGSGIPDKIKDRIFQPFFTTKPPGEGSGLGLDIVSKIVEKHQGKIEVESQPGKTTFSVWLPI